MIRIKEISRKGKNAYVVTFEKNGEEIRQTLHQDTLIKHNLLNAAQIDEEGYRRMLRDDRFHVALDKGLALLSKRTLSKRNCRKALLASTSPAVADQVVERLEKEGYIDDQKALEYFVDDAIEYDTKGPRLLREKLIQEGYDKEQIDRVLLRFDEEKQRQKARALLEKTLPTYRKDHPVRKIKEKLRVLLYRKGFDADVFNGEIDKIIKPLEETHDEDALLRRRIDKLRGRYSTDTSKEKQRFIAKLLREGFSYESITKRLD